MHSFKNQTAGDKIFYVIVTIILSVFLLLVLYPCIYVVSSSFSSGTAVNAGKVILWPVDFTLEGYKTVFNTSTIWIGFGNSMLYMVLGTMFNLTLTMTAAYCMSRRDLPGRNIMMMLFTFTMFFSGGIIANYMLVQGLGLLNTRLVMIVTGGITAYNLIIAKTNIQNSIPQEMLEAAQIDGCSDITYFFRIVIPLSQSIIAVLTLLYAVTHWNSYFGPMIYLSDESLYPLTLFLREILLLGQIDPSTVEDPELQAKLAETAGIIKYALIVVSMIPVLVIYPFVQKHFVKGIMIGSVKG